MKNSRTGKPKKSDKADIHKKAAKGKRPAKRAKPKKKAVETVKDRVAKTKEEFLEVFRESLAIITVACQKTGAKGIHRSTFYDWYKQDEGFAARVDEIRGEQATQVEDRLMKAIIRDDLRAIIFYLKSKHPDYQPKLRALLNGHFSHDHKHTHAILTEDQVNELLRRRTNAALPGGKVQPD